MKKVGLGALTMGLALVATGCSDNVIGADGPRPGIAAQVEDAEITLDDLDKVTDGLCTIQKSNPQAVGTSRAYAESQILQAWVLYLLDAEHAEAEGLEVSPVDPGLEQAPGYDDVDEDDLDALEDYVDAFAYSEGVAAAREEGAEPPDPADYDIVLNPRFDLELSADGFVPAGDQLSIPVSEEGAVSTEAPAPEDLQDLSDAEICGTRPEPQGAPPPVPVG